MYMYQNLGDNSHMSTVRSTSNPPGRLGEGLGRRQRPQGVAESLGAGAERRVPKGIRKGFIDFIVVEKRMLDVGIVIDMVGGCWMFLGVK